MKKIFWLLPLLMWQSVVAQQAIYTIDVNGDILTNSQFIDPFFCVDKKEQDGFRASGSSKLWNKVYEYTPAPGQFINESR